MLRVLRNIGLFIAAPFIALAYLIALPLVFAATTFGILLKRDV